jgi:hypothetical protein
MLISRENMADCDGPMVADRFYRKLFSAGENVGAAADALNPRPDTTEAAISPHQCGSSAFF